MSTSSMQPSPNAAHAEVICFTVTDRRGVGEVEEDQEMRGMRKRRVGEGAQNIATLFRLFSLTFPHYNLFFPRHSFSASSSSPFYPSTTQTTYKRTLTPRASLRSRGAREGGG